MTALWWTRRHRRPSVNSSWSLTVDRFGRPVFLCPSVRPSVCLSICLSASLSDTVLPITLFSYPFNPVDTAASDIAVYRLLAVLFCTDYGASAVMISGVKVNAYMTSIMLYLQLQADLMACLKLLFLLITTQ